MKKIIAVLLSLVMAAVLVPAVFAEVSADDVSVTYTGQTVNATGSSYNVGSSFYFTLSISDNSRLWSGHWLIDYPEQYVTPMACSYSWAGSICDQIIDLIDEGTNYTDTPAFAHKLDYEGMTGGAPCGEAGNYYTAVGMYLSTFTFGGMFIGGPMVRVRYRIDALPSTNAASHDNGGYYLEFPITVVESRYWIEGMPISPDVTYYKNHEHVSVVDGKVYMNTVQAVMHTVRFYGYNNQLLSTQQVEDGFAAVAPNVQQVINNSSGTYLFYEWDTDFSSVTSDLNVHADYVLLGDVNFDGVVDTADATLVLRNSMNLISFNEKQVFAGNVDTLPGIATSDALKILRYSLNLISTLA